MRCSAGTIATAALLAGSICMAPGPASADTISYFDGTYSIVGQTLGDLGYNTSDTAIESTAETFTAPGSAGSLTTLNFTFVRDLGGYQFTFGIFDRATATADPVSDRRAWALQALSAATVVFDNREIDTVGATQSVHVAAGTELGLFLIPNDTLARVLDDPDAFFGGGRPDPLFSVSDANPGSFDQLLSFEAGGLHTFAFEDLSRTGWSDQDYNDVIVTMSAETAQLTQLAEEVSEPAGAALTILLGLPLMLARWRRRR